MRLQDVSELASSGIHNFLLDTIFLTGQLIGTSIQSKIFQFNEGIKTALRDHSEGGSDDSITYP